MAEGIRCAVRTLLITPIEWIRCTSLMSLNLKRESSGRERTLGTSHFSNRKTVFAGPEVNEPAYSCLVCATEVTSGEDLSRQMLSRVVRSCLNAVCSDRLVPRWTVTAAGSSGFPVDDPAAVRDKRQLGIWLRLLHSLSAGGKAAIPLARSISASVGTCFPGWLELGMFA